MQHRDGMRPRQIDDNKLYQVIKDIETAKKTLSPEDRKELEKIEKDLQKAINHFDNKKKIEIPKSLILENNNLNNNEKNVKKNQNQNSNNQKSDIPVYTLKEYKRPDNYIIYSSKEREQIKTKDYEAKYPDQVFLKFHGDFMKIEELEKIISTLENNIGKGEKIPDEMAKKLIEENFKEYKSKSDLIIKHFNDRRNELKKSLLRKYWRLQKSTDKYFNITFRRRERDKMKIRKNNQKKDESFEIVKMACDLCKTKLITIINAMAKKEQLNKEKNYLENIMFLSEINHIQKNLIPKEYITKNNEIISSLKEKGITIEDPSLSIIHWNNREENEKDKSPESKGGISSGEMTKEDSYKRDEEFNRIEKEANQNDIIYPPINFGLINSLKEKNRNINNKYRVRVRFNRMKKLTVDRYIQNNDSMDPFDDEFNDNIMKYQKYDKNLCLNSTFNIFENLIKDYYEQKYKYLSYISDYDEDYESFFKSKNNNKRVLNKKRAYKNN
jgi:hypothetical protein